MSGGNTMDSAARWEFEAPEYHYQGMGCGLEDRGIYDRYEAMAYGWDQAIERCVERIPEELYLRPANAITLELAEALEAMVERFGHDIFTMPAEDRDLLTRAVNALAKAKGEGA